jgi:YVTN family beta-propeller protein
MDISADGKMILVASRWAAKLTVIDTASNKVVRQVNVGKSPHGVWTLDHARAIGAASWRSVLQGCWRLAIVFIAASQCFFGAGGQKPPKSSCAKPLYLTFDTGHMDIAPSWWPTCCAARRCG